jgi:exopolyphosphatase/guanosine-5'-triphosphate,3'-diphosphate pyrophosphatase
LPAGRIGIIDIGSNSVRLVVFEALARSPVTLFNEKALCGLARSLDRTGLLDRIGRRRAIETIHRFIALARAMRVDRLDLIATAAVREAVDGREFVDLIERRFGAEVNVLSGKEEARLVGLSVAAAIPNADGVVGDLGGGSLEFVDIKQGRVRDIATLPLGTLRLPKSGKRNIGKSTKQVDRELDKVGWLKRLRGRTFYPIGGAWRALARLDIAQRGYPLHVVDQYAMSRRETEALTAVIQVLSAKSLERVPFIGAARLSTLPTAALILRRVLLAAEPAGLVFCASGIREGHLFEILPEPEKQRDPLIAGCRAIAESVNRFGENGDEIFAWSHPLFPNERNNGARYRHGACLLADWAWREHPDARADSAFHRALQLSLPGIDHRERCLIALALYHRYGAPVGGKVPETPRTILGDGDVEGAQRLGLALRLAMSLSGGAPDVVGRTSLMVGKKRLTLSCDRDVEAAIGDVVRRRLKALAAHMGLESRLVLRRRIIS